MVPIEIDPYAFEIGTLSIRWYAIMIVLGIITALVCSLREADLRRLSRDEVLNLALIGIIAGVIGARLFHVLDYLNLYAANPARIFALYEGGLSVYGGLLTGLAAAVIYMRVRHLPIWEYLDMAAAGIIMGLIIGRIGNLINGDAWGKETGAAWGVIYTSPDALVPGSLLGIPSHPVPLYEIIGGLVILTLLSNIRMRQAGMSFLLFMLLYALLRIITGFFRESPLLFLDLNQAQWIGLLVLVGTLFGFMRVQRQQERKNQHASVDPV